MAVGTLGAAANGIVLPLFSLVFGEVVSGAWGDDVGIVTVPVW